MVRVTISTVDERKEVLAAETSSPKQILTDNSINFSRATLMLDGIILDANTVNKSLTELAITDECTLAVSIKMDNA